MQITPKLAIRSPRSLPDVAVHVGRGQCSSMPRHAHDEVQIGAYEGGLRRFRIGTRDVDATAGHLVVVPSGEAHSGRAEGAGSTFRLIYIGEHYFQTLAEEVGGPSSHLAPFAGKSPCHAHLLSVVDAFARGTCLRQESLLLGFVAGLLGVHGGDGRSPRRHEPAAVRRAKRYLRERLDASVTLAELAREAGLSKYHLLRAFREAVGLPPHAYLTHLRIARGKKMLRAGTSPADVAAALGFVDQSHFARHFRSQVGTSPSRYQRAMTE